MLVIEASYMRYSLLLSIGSQVAATLVELAQWFSSLCWWQMGSSNNEEVSIGLCLLHKMSDLALPPRASQSLV